MLKPEQASAVDVRAEEGRITLSGTLPDASALPVMERLVRAVPGVVDAEVRLVTPN
nr:BON domain-containing protein [Streptomyces sp. TLI_235]